MTRLDLTRRRRQRRTALGLAGFAAGFWAGMGVLVALAGGGR